jgi:beta-glucosidase
MQMYISSIPFAVVTWNGTDGEDVTLKTQVVLLSRNGVMRIHFSAPGVKLKKMSFRYLRPFTENDTL